MLDAWLDGVSARHWTNWPESTDDAPRWSQRIAFPHAMLWEAAAARYVAALGNAPRPSAGPAPSDELAMLRAENEALRQRNALLEAAHEPPAPTVLTWIAGEPHTAVPICGAIVGTDDLGRPLICSRPPGHPSSDHAPAARASDDPAREVAALTALDEQIASAEQSGEDPEHACWGHQSGVLLSLNHARALRTLAAPAAPEVPRGE